ncbi:MULTISPECIES: response regulator transcription factor [Sphingobacterium]|uniref:Helix-turn-helix domain-containing protein n=1 Tax=Sphingobacterium populi TaxID=1812824 RepID=A0ABW5UFI4_9SPHI|nr:DNA-binding response regulator [Sphingobacterium sp. CFCC 11742]
MVDDNVDIRNYVARIFEKDFQVFALSGSSDAEKLINSIQPLGARRDELTREIAEVELATHPTTNKMWQHTPVILLIASSSPETDLSGLHVDADKAGTQPFDKELLLAHVQNLLQQHAPSVDRLSQQPPSESTNISQKHEFLAKVTRIVEEHLDDPRFNVQMLAEAISMSHSNFYRRIKAISGKSANEFIRHIRLRKVAKLLTETEYNVSEAAFAAGFNDIKYFRAKFLKLFGMKPSEYKKKHINMHNSA